MKVILKQDIKGIGKKDEIHEVSDGYALWQNRRLVLFARGSFFETDSPGRGRWHKVPEGEQLASRK